MIAPEALSRAGGHVAGTLAAETMGRLRAAVEDVTETAYEFRFETDEPGRTWIEGRIEASVVVVCQRCLESFRLALVARPRLLALRADDDPRDAQGEEAVPVDARGRVDLVNLIEDELLLALPQSPRHENEAECRIDDRFRPGASPQPTHRPLAALEEIRGRG